MAMCSDARQEPVKTIRRKCGNKVKSGCRTCKIRRLKCDEGRPACRRCISTGRACDGYGIWGGGGNNYDKRERSIVSENGTLTHWPLLSLSILAAGTKEKLSFEWFRHRTSKKIPGMYVFSNFWDKLIFQACLSEPAVLHAVLTLSSVHRWGTLDGDIRHDTDDGSLQDKETFTLQQYTKAIHELQSHLSTKDRSSIRITLISCVVFVCLELLRGHFQTAQLHLQSGLRVLVEMQEYSRVGNSGGPLPTRLLTEPVDSYIIEALSRLRVQSRIFNHTYHQQLNPLLLDPGTVLAHPTFSSIKEASKAMDWIMNRIFDLKIQARPRHDAKSMPNNYPTVLDAQQQGIHKDLRRWLVTFNASRTEIEYSLTESQKRELCESCVWRLLRTYHTMAMIMAGTCLESENESVFDLYTGQFLFIIKQSSGHLKKNKTDICLPGQQFNMARSVVDIGWVPPLYFTALKCRVHRIRLQAIRFLATSSHREGIWDSKLTTTIASKVIEIEEGDFYSGVDKGDDFELMSMPGKRDLSLPLIPESYRLQEVQVLLPNSPTDSLVLSCRRKQMRGDWEMLTKEYQLLSQAWVDKD